MIQAAPSNSLANAPRDAGQEVPFDLRELIYSRTDERGVIQAANDVFGRLAGYSFDEFVGAPHKLIRHPDMPRGVFQLFWDTIKSGATVGAYVKNQASDGSYYWVFAVVTPCDGGYLSARIKPTSALLKTVEQEYTRLRQAEQAEELSPEDSAARLLARLQELGFATYNDFAGHALAEELLTRDAGLNRAADPRLAERRTMHSTAGKLVEETEALVQEFESMRTIPHNLRVIASRIEPAGGPVTVLSENYNAMSRDMSNWFEAHVWGKNSNFRAIKRYNNSDAYAIGVGHLADRIAGGGPLRGKFPPDANGLTKDDRIALQRRLTAKGFDTGGADGVLGPKSQVAIRAYQSSIGLPATGQPSPELLRRLG